MKKTKIVSILITAIMLMQTLAITSFAEDVNTFPLELSIYVQS